jgi:hypothetical protein
MLPVDGRSSLHAFANGKERRADDVARELYYGLETMCGVAMGLCLTVRGSRSRAAFGQ